MNKKLFLIPVAAALLASCSNEDFDNGDNTNTGETEIRYLAVNIIDNSGTRADYTSNLDYEEGKTPENEVTSIRFYLFNENGTKYVATPYVDATAEDDGKNLPNVEKKLQAVIVYEAEKSSEGAKPVQIVAVLNAPEGLGEVDNIGVLQSKVGNYLNTNSGKFIITNSVYTADGSTEHVGFKVESANQCDSKAAALANPVEIYVERVVAKARVKLGDNLKKAEGVTGNNIYEISTLTNNQETIYGSNGQPVTKKVYLKLLGWDVTATASESRLVKKINPAWGFESNGWLGENFAWGTNNAWNYPTFFRSYWAQNPNVFENEENGKKELQFGNFNGSGTTSNNQVANTNPALKYEDFTVATECYMQENAAWTSAGMNPNYPTKLIVAAQLVGDDGEGLNLGWFAGSYYMQEDLKQVILSNAKIFKKTSGDAGAETYAPATIEDLTLKFITTTAAGIFDKDGNQVEGRTENVNRYNSYVQLEGNSIDANTYYVKNSNGSYTVIADAADLNAKLKAVGEVKVWTSGYTYYWLDIEHLGAAGQYGQYGVVRNHIYEYELGSFKGFGIPVLDPNETIYPEEPNDPEMMYIAARINILAWRLVSHSNTALGW